MNGGLTFGEMLVVLLVFSILAVMFFFSSNLAINKAKLARTGQDLKTLARALSSYEGEYYEIPSEDQGLTAVVHARISALSRIPQDPFTPAKMPREYGYYSDFSPKYRWILVSVGPDGRSDVDDALVELDKNNPGKAAAYPTGVHPLHMSDEDAQKFITEHSYDPTNGSDSAGDVITLYGQ